MRIAIEFRKDSIRQWEETRVSTVHSTLHSVRRNRCELRRKSVRGSVHGCRRNHGTLVLGKAPSFGNPPLPLRNPPRPPFLLLPMDFPRGSAIFTSTSCPATREDDDRSQLSCRPPPRRHGPKPLGVRHYMITASATLPNFSK